MKIYSIEINNLGQTGMFSGSLIPHGTLGVTVDEHKFDLYERVGCAIFSRCGELVNVYQHAPGTNEGFAGREIQLRIKEPSCMFPKVQAARLYTFKGDLWDGYKADLEVAKHLGTELHSIGVRTLKNRNSCYFSTKATSKFMETIAKAVVFGKPEQGDFSADLKEQTA